MPSITLNNPEDKATVKRFLSSPNTRIITATVARLYIAHPDPYQWTYSDILGAVALIQTSHTFYLRIVDLLYGRGIVWEQELYDGFVYSQDKTFFHTFQADNYVAGFSFADEHEAEVFFSKVHGRAQLRPFKPVPSAGAMAKSGKAAGAQGRAGKIPMHNGKLDKSRIGLPSDFRHVGHIGWDPDVGFDAQNIDPAWRELFEQLDTCGVSRQQINENATFITEFVSAHGGFSEKVANGTHGHLNSNHQSKGHIQSKADLSRIDSPPPARPLSPQQKRPPPPPPPVNHNSSNSNNSSGTSPPTTPSLVSPAPFHGYLPRPLAQVMASLSFGSSSFYGATGQSPQSPQSPLLSGTPLDPVQDQQQKDFSPTNGATLDPPPVAAAPPPPPPPPPPMMTKYPTATQPLSIKTSNLVSSLNISHGPSSEMRNVVAASASLATHASNPLLRSPVERGSLLASIRESGGVQGLRKTGGLRSPPPAQKRAVSPIGASHSQGDLVSALVAALQRRQTKLTYSDDEEDGQRSDEDDGWDAD